MRTPLRDGTGCDVTPGGRGTTVGPPGAGTPATSLPLDKARVSVETAHETCNQAGRSLEIDDRHDLVR